MNRALVSTLLALALAAPAISGTEPPHVIGDVIVDGTAKADPTRPVVRLLITQFAYPNTHYEIIEPTVRRMQELFGRNNFQARVYSGEQLRPGEADFVLSSAGTYWRAVNQGAHAIATAVSDLRPDPNKGEGSVFVTLKSRTDIRSFEDLQGRRASVASLKAFSGYHIALGEIFRRQENPDTFFSSVSACGNDMRCTLRELRSGKADVAIVRTCFLEELARLGAATDDLKPVAVRQNKDDRCVTSTELFPNWTLFSMPGASPESIRELTAALLAIPPHAGQTRWSIASDFSGIDSLYRNIRLGPYEYLRTWSLMRFLEQYGLWVLFTLFALLGLSAHGYFAERLVTKRTRELNDALVLQQQSERRALEARSHLAVLQKAGAVGQISSIIAHELRQPLSTILAYVHGLQRLMEQGEGNPERIEKTLEKIGMQTERADQIVQRVREYAKSKERVRQDVSLARLAMKSVQTVNEGHSQAHKAVYEGPEEGIWVTADPLELELCIVNLANNALQAVEQTADGRVTVRLTETEGTVVLEVCDNGPALDDAAFARLQEPLQSTKIDGLGLGLAIVKLIVTNHRGKITFTRRSPHGLCASLRLPASENTHG